MSFLRPCQQLEDIELNVITPDLEMKTKKLSDYTKGNKYLVIVWFPLAYTFACPTAVVKFSDEIEKFRKYNCEVIIGSTDSQFTLHSWCMTPRSEGGIDLLNCDMFSDLNHNFAKRLGILLDAGHSLRATYILSPKLICRHVSINDLPVERNLDEVVRLLAAFRYSDEHGDLAVGCNWNPDKPNDQTIKQDVKGKLDYFHKQFQ